MKKDLFCKIFGLKYSTIISLFIAQRRGQGVAILRRISYTVSLEFLLLDLQ